MHRAVSAVSDEIAPVLVVAELDDPRSLDRVMIELDGTPDKHRLGGNAIYFPLRSHCCARRPRPRACPYTYVGALLGLKPPTTVPAERSSPHFARVVLISVETR